VAGQKLIEQGFPSGTTAPSSSWAGRQGRRGGPGRPDTPGIATGDHPGGRRGPRPGVAIGTAADSTRRPTPPSPPSGPPSRTRWDPTAGGWAQRHRLRRPPATVHDEKLVIPLVLLVVFLVLMVLLRAVLGPSSSSPRCPLLPGGPRVAAVVNTAVFGFAATAPPCRCSASSSWSPWGATTTSSSWPGSARRPSLRHPGGDPPRAVGHRRVITSPASSWPGPSRCWGCCRSSRGRDRLHRGLRRAARHLPGAVGAGTRPGLDIGPPGGGRADCGGTTGATGRPSDRPSRPSARTPGGDLTSRPPGRTAGQAAIPTMGRSGAGPPSTPRTGTEGEQPAVAGHLVVAGRGGGHPHHRQVERLAAHRPEERAP